MLGTINDMNLPDCRAERHSCLIYQQVLIEPLMCQALLRRVGNETNLCTLGVYNKSKDGTGLEERQIRNEF